MLKRIFDFYFQIVRQGYTHEYVLWWSLLTAIPAYRFEQPFLLSHFPPFWSSILYSCFNMCCLYYLPYICLYKKWEVSWLFPISKMEIGKSSNTLMWSQPANAAELHASSSSANITKLKITFICCLASHLPEKLQLKCLGDSPFQSSAVSSPRCCFEGKWLCNIFCVFRPRLNFEKTDRLEPR